jgi:hypothetical protein
LQPQTLEEVREAIMAAQLYKALGIDGIPAIMQKELWPVSGRKILLLFHALIQSERYR